MKLKRKTIPTELLIIRLKNEVDCDRQTAQNLRNDFAEKSALQWEHSARGKEIILEMVTSWAMNDDPCHILEFVKCPENNGTLNNWLKEYQRS
jgi:hypothetical protein